MAVHFQDPPTKGRKRHVYDWDQIYAELKANPGQWAWLNPHHVGHISTYNAIVQGDGISNFNLSMGIEMRTSDNNLKAKPRTCNLFARYLPEKDQSLTVKQRQKAMIEMRKKQKISTVESEE